MFGDPATGLFLSPLPKPDQGQGRRGPLKVRVEVRIKERKPARMRATVIPGSGIEIAVDNMVMHRDLFLKGDSK